MQRLLTLSMLSLLLATPAYAQSQAVGTERVGWDQAAPTLEEAQSYTYTPLIDTTTAPAKPAAFEGVTCTGDAPPFLCVVRLPAMTTGLHELRVTAAITVGTQVLTSAPSAPLAVLIRTVPATPANLRLLP